MKTPWLAVACLAAAATGCRSKVGALRDALIVDDVAQAGAVVGGPKCSEAACLDRLARALGSSHGFDANDPDQASAAAVALVLVREHRGDIVPDADRWIAAATLARGHGADALRLAIARGMAELAPRVGKRWESEAEAGALMHDMADAIPGACETYVLLAKTPADALPANKRPEGSACVQRDLERKEGPGAGYGHGVWRAAAAVVALWKDEVRALRTGVAYAEADARPALEAKLALAEAATAKIELP